MAHPPSGGAIAADVGESLVIVPIWGAERNLLDGLVHDEVLTNRQPTHVSPITGILSLRQRPGKKKKLGCSGLFKAVCTAAASLDLASLGLIKLIGSEEKVILAATIITVQWQRGLGVVIMGFSFETSTASGCICRSAEVTPLSPG